MGQDGIQKVLSCSNLPSLPSVAVRVLELTRDPDVSLKAMAEIVEQDQALAGKILRTVNSSFYGLAQPCGTVSRALNYLGLNTVKSLVLGFSLVDSTNAVGEGTQFDLQDHWSRCIYGAVSARIIGLRFRRCDPDEAFTASLFQDVGVLAAVTALGKEYVQVLQDGEPGDDQQTAREKAALQFDHTTVGAALAEKWRLPEAYVSVIRYHHDPDAAPSSALQLVRTSVLGRLATGVIMKSRFAADCQSRFDAYTREWFGQEISEIDQVFSEIRSAAREVAKLFDQELTEAPSAEALMAEAQERSIELQIQSERESTTDGLTGVGNRRRFDERLKALFEQASEQGTSLAVILCDGDRFKLVNDTHGHQAGDEVLREIGARLSRVVGDRGEVFRYGGEEFTVLLSDVSLDEARNMAERMREAMASKPVDISSLGLEASELAVTLSVGVCRSAPGEPDWPSDPEELVARADQALYRAKENGRNRVECAGASRSTPQADADETGSIRVLLVEDDPFAAAIWRTLFKSEGAIDVTIESGTPGVQRLLESGFEPEVAIVDYYLAVGIGPDVIKMLRAKFGRELPVMLMTARLTPEIRQSGLSAGATACMSKAELCHGLSKTIREIKECRTHKLWAA